jgi:CheY-like chemotaxis protein
MPKTLLLADDSVVIQKLVGLSFANLDVELMTADDGDAALSLARARRPDVIILDVVMPGRSGYEVCEALQRDPALAQIPVLLLTGTFEGFDEGRARQVGAVGHITKPFEAQVLVDRVTALFDAAATLPPHANPSPFSPAEESSERATDPFDLFEDDLADLTAAAFIPNEVRPETPGEAASVAGLPGGDPTPQPTEISHQEIDLELDLDLADFALDDGFADANLGSSAFEPRDAEVSPDWLSHNRSDAPTHEPREPEVQAPLDATIVPLGAAPTSEAPMRAAAEPSAAPNASEALPAAMREQLAETLEKIAWEAFSDLSDQVVREVLQRVETIAWEVIPQLTETIIREEIRRLKDEPNERS